MYFLTFQINIEEQLNNKIIQLKRSQKSEHIRKSVMKEMISKTMKENPSNIKNE